VNASARKIIAALTFTKAGDRVVDAKTVLAWLLAALGAPAITVGLLVPVREAGSLLPQAALVPWVQRFDHRKWVWVIGAVGQAVAVGLMAFVAGLANGAVAGWGVLGALALFALSRSLSSIATKDVIGRTVDKGYRGRVTGWSDTMSGLVAVTLGLGIRVLGADQPERGPLVVLIAVAATAWVFASLVFSTIDEPSGEDDGDGEIGVAAALNLFRTDPPFRRFVIARSLLLVSALSPPFVVTIAADRVGASVAQLGPFVVATGLASLVAGRLWGGAADRSSRLVMVTASGIGALIVVVFLGLLGPLGERTGLYIGTYLALAVVHTGARVGRSTYVVDLAEGDLRTQYVAASNTAMGVILLVVGAITGGLSTLGPEVALVTLAAIGLAGVPTSLSLPEVSRPAT
jgi:hypothetical protein